MDVSALWNLYVLKLQADGLLVEVNGEFKVSTVQRDTARGVLFGVVYAFFDFFLKYGRFREARIDDDDLQYENYRSEVNACSEIDIQTQTLPVASACEQIT